jgi:hypothetical protein
MSISTRRSGGTTHFQSTRRRSGDGAEGEGVATGQAACVEPDRTFGRTYLQRGLSGYHRPKRPGRDNRKTWRAEDPLPGDVTKPQLAAVNEAIPTGTKETVVSQVKHRGGCRRSKRRGEQ